MDEHEIIQRIAEARGRELDRAVEQIVELVDERDRLRAKLHELMARDVDAVDLMNVEHGCPECGVHHACGEIVAERDRLRAVVDAARDVVATWRVLERTGPKESSSDAYAEWLRASEVLEAAVDQLDGSADMGEADT